MTTPQNARTDEQIAACFAVIHELRPHLDKESFVPMVRRMQEEGFQLASLQEAGETVAVAGYRIHTNLYMGKNLYVDDLVTAAAHRSRGHGETLLKWLGEQAVREGCKVIHLDSGTQRQQAHKFYFRQGLVVTSFHFARNVAEG